MIKATLALSDGVLGLVLLGSAVGSLLAIPVAGWLVAKHGAKQVGVISAILFCVALLLPGLATGPVTLSLSLLVFGGIGGTNGVAMNSQAVALENLLGRPVMSGFHAMFSLGGIVGSLFGSLMTTFGLDPLQHFGIAGAILLGIVAASSSLQVETGIKQGKQPKLALRQLPPALLLLCLLGFCIFLSEGAIADWTSVYLAQGLHANPGLAAAGYGVFSGAMTVFRLLGDRLTAYFGRTRSFRTGAFFAAGGVAWFLSMPSPWLALPGLAFAGAGYSVLIPLVFAAAGRIPKIVPSAGIATVSGLGYIAFLIGPPLIGGVAQTTSLRTGLALLIPLALMAALLPFSDGAEAQVPALQNS